MGFYGNITNTSRTQFQFDKIYPNRYDMDNSKSTDGIYAGRFVLVEYDEATHLDTFIRAQKKVENGTTKFYYNPTGETSFTTLLTKGIIAAPAMIYTTRVETTPEDGYHAKDCIFYICTSELSEDSREPATFEEIVNGNGVPNYTINYNIDTNTYGSGRGYDSTVWQKTYIDGVEKYIMIAELNTVVPTFDVAADAPTQRPLVPHFDTQSTDVYYKLHWQPTWGFRIKEESPQSEINSKNKEFQSSIDTNNYPSDEEAYHYTYSFDPNTGINKPNTEEKYNAAIFYNKAGFDKAYRTYYSSDESTQNDKEGHYKDSISIAPTGQSGAEYNIHDGTSATHIDTDIQEMRILLPSLGNTISDIWDLIYGYNPNNRLRFRDVEWKDAETGEENMELGGMTRDLSTVAGCINTVHDLMGMIITDKNNAVLNEEWFNKNYIYKGSDGYYRIHKYPIYTTFNVNNFNLPIRNNYASDQEYNTAYEEALLEQLDENKQYYLIIDGNKNNNQVKVLNKKSLSSLEPDDIIGYQSDNYGYEFVIIPDMPGKMATIYGLILKIKNLLEVEDSETRDTSTIMGSINAINDIIDVFEDLTPGEFLICDSNGKVNSANWTTAQDYSYTNYNSDNPQSTDKEFDTKENRWISLSVDEKNREIELKHVFNQIDDTNTTANKNNASGSGGINNSTDDTLKLYTPIVDAMGHIVGKNIETVTLPYGFKKITTNGEVNSITTDMIPMIGTSVADNTQDEFFINVGNKWLHASMDDTTDTLTLAHEVNPINIEEKISTNLNDGTDSIIIQDIQHDAAGHIIANQNHTYILPYGYKTFKTNGRNMDENTKNSDSVGITETTADNTQDIINIDSGNYWIRADITNDNIKLSHSVRDIDIIPNNSTNFNTEINAVNENNINIPDWTYDAAGHIRSKKDHYYTLPFGYKTITPATQSTAITNPTVNTTPIVADNTQDTLTIASANKWIRVSGDDTNDTLSIGHEVHNFESGSANTKYGLETNVTVSDLDVDNTFEVPVLKFDEAGHITMAETHTVTVPENFNKVDITTTGKDSVAVNISSAAATLEADTLTDTVTFDVGNRWIQLVGNASTDKVSIHHAAPGAQTNTTKTGDETPNYGTPFNIPEVKYDEAGHISGVATHTVTFPTPSLNDLPVSTASVVTGIQMVDGTLAITQTNANVGTRALTEYLIGSNNEDIVATDSINTAFGKLQVQIHEEEDNRAKTVTNLDTKLSTEINNLNTELSNEINNVNTNLTNSIENEATTRTNAITNLQNKITAEETARIEAINALDYSSPAVANKYISEVTQTDGKIAVTRAALPDYSTQWTKISTLEETVRTQGETIATLQSTIAELIARIETLEEYHAPQETPKEETPITGE